MHPVSQADVTELRIRYRTEYEFAVERNCIDDGAYVSQADIRAAIQSMSASERRVLRSRLRRKFRKLDDLTQGTRKTFDEPYATPDNLVDGVQLANESEHG
jgi:hypothetical protein